jgi:2-oxoglutarate dehydrogenase E2 component (dihydrolipoamide succinyltransferase)
MILEMKVPPESITEVEIATWLVKTEIMEKDQAIAEVDSDKATLEITCGSEDYHIESGRGWQWQ